MLAGLHVFEGCPQLFQSKPLVDPRLQAVGLDRADHLLQMIPAADGDAAQFQILGKYRRHRQGVHSAGQKSDDGDMPAQPERGDRLRQRIRTADLDDMIDTGPLRQLARGIGPIACLAVIDQVVGAQRRFRVSGWTMRLR